MFEIIAGKEIVRCCLYHYTLWNPIFQKALYEML
jgi:hypothetical protein